MRPQIPQRASWTRRIRHAGAIAIAMVLVVCTITVQAQEAASAHVRCQEHGQLVHLQGVASEGAGDHAIDVAHLPSRGAIVADHEHCPLAGTTHSTSSPHPVLAVARVAAVVDLHAPIPNEHVTKVTLRFAPKTSPPA